MGFKQDQLTANAKVASTESVTLWLISHRQIVNFLVSVRINDCNLDASLMLPLLTKSGDHHSPFTDLLGSKSMKVLDLSNNPLFKCLYDQPRLDEYQDVERSGLSAVDPLDVVDRIHSQMRQAPLDKEAVKKEEKATMRRREKLRIRAIRDFSEALRRNTSLTEIYFSSTCMDPYATIKILEALSEPNEKGQMRKLDLSHNPLLKAKMEYVISNEALEVQALTCVKEHQSHQSSLGPDLAAQSSAPTGQRGARFDHSEDCIRNSHQSPFVSALHNVLDPVNKAVMEIERASKELRSFKGPEIDSLAAEATSPKPRAFVKQRSFTDATVAGDRDSMRGPPLKSISIPAKRSPPSTISLAKLSSKSLRESELERATNPKVTDFDRGSSQVASRNGRNGTEGLARKTLELHLLSAEDKLKEAVQKLKEGDELRNTLHDYYVRTLEMALTHCNGVFDLSLSTTFLQKEQLGPLMQGVRLNGTLTRLDLSNSPVVNEELKESSQSSRSAFETMLMENKSIQSLILRHTGEPTAVSLDSVSLE
jgi:hypothetical protein